MGKPIDKPTGNLICSQPTQVTRANWHSGDNVATGLASPGANEEPDESIALGGEPERCKIPRPIEVECGREGETQELQLDEGDGQ